MPISRKKEDYILLLIEELKKIIANILNKNDLSKEEVISLINEGLKLATVSIEDIREQRMEKIIEKYNDIRLLIQLDHLIGLYLQYENEPIIEEKRAILQHHLEENNKSCSFLDFYK